jgi:four helix bundle protein
MNSIELKKRTQKFAIDVIKFTEELPLKRSINILVNQLLRCSSSVGANYRSACRGKSMADFINKIVIVGEEADESVYWLELIEGAGLVNPEAISMVKKEANELTAIFTAIGKTAKENQRKLNQKLRNNKSEIEHPNFEIKKIWR